jgi:hypothetical protein
MRSIVLAICVGLLDSGLVLAQGEANSPPDSYTRCANTMNSNPQAAYKSCKEYLDAYPRDDNERLRLVANWVNAYERGLNYAKSLQSFLNTMKGKSWFWFIYEPELKIELPNVVEKMGNYKIEIVRTFSNAQEEELLRKAEAVYGPQYRFLDVIQWNPALWAADLPDQVVPLWGSRGNDNVQITEVITASAILYYYELSLAMRNQRPFRNVFKMIGTGLKYHGEIKHFDEYKHAGKEFRNVYVADLNLEWSSICGGLCGVGFKRNKLVVLDAKGAVLELFLDAPENHSMWVS